MSIFENMSEEEIIAHFANIFAVIRKFEQEVAHIVIGPQDWYRMREVYNFFEPEKDKERFEKGCCAKVWGAQIWIASKAEKIKAYTSEQKKELKKDFPDIAKTIKELKIK